jgi:hypothetical protein
VRNRLRVSNKPQTLGRAGAHKFTGVFMQQAQQLGHKCLHLGFANGIYRTTTYKLISIPKRYLQNKRGMKGKEIENLISYEEATCIVETLEPSRPVFLSVTFRGRSYQLFALYNAHGRFSCSALCLFY